MSGQVDVCLMIDVHRISEFVQEDAPLDQIALLVRNLQGLLHILHTSLSRSIPPKPAPAPLARDPFFPVPVPSATPWSSPYQPWGDPSPLPLE